MTRDAELMHVAMPPDKKAVQQDLARLIEANGMPNCTLRLAVIRNAGACGKGPRAESLRTSSP